MQVRDSLSASLLEPKQVEKICFHNIPEGGVYEWSYKRGEAAWVPFLITRPDQGRRACQPRSVLDQLCAMRSKYSVQG